MLTLPLPPLYLRGLPDDALRSNSRSRSDVATRVMRALTEREIYARPTLAEIEAERARRGMRAHRLGVVVEVRKPASGVVAPYIPGPCWHRANLGRGPSEHRAGPRDHGRLSAVLWPGRDPVLAPDQRLTPAPSADGPGRSRPLFLPPERIPRMTDTIRRWALRNTETGHFIVFEGFRPVARASEREAHVWSSYRHAEKSRRSVSMPSYLEVVETIRPAP